MRIQLFAALAFLLLVSPSRWECLENQNNPEILLEAVRNADLGKVLLLLGQGIDVNCRGRHQYTPLVVAAKYNRLEIAKVLCDKGADVNSIACAAEIEHESGYSPLIWAAFNCNKTMAELLLARGAGVDRTGAEGDTPLMIASRSGCLDLVRRFIEKGATINKVCEYDGATALAIAAGKGHLEIADYLIEYGAKIDIKDNYGRTLLAQAASAGSLPEVRYFFEKGLPVNGRDDSGHTPMFYALGKTSERRAILEYLIEHGGDLNIKSGLGTTPLMQASLDWLDWAVHFLLTKGASVNDHDLNNETPLHYACRGIPNGLSDNIPRKEIDKTIGLLIDKGANINAKDRNGKTPLMISVCATTSWVAEYLLDRGACADTQDCEGRTALMFAALWNRTEAIKVLAARGANLDLRNLKGETALVIAKQRMTSAQAYELLRSLGARD